MGKDVLVISRTLHSVKGYDAITATFALMN